jgi:hypothetical protein
MTLKGLLLTLFFTIPMAFNPEVALFNLLEDAQTSEELLSVIDDFLTEDEEV